MVARRQRRPHRGGFVAGACAAESRTTAVLDLALLKSCGPCACAAVFTRNQVVAAPVILDRETLASTPTASTAVVANSGNANACTGAPGLANARQMQDADRGRRSPAAPEDVLVLSTGVIGVQLPIDEDRRRHSALPRSDLSAAHGPAAADAIMTTDTVKKHAACASRCPAGR